MAPLVAPGICRFSLIGTIWDRPWANVLDMHIESGGIGTRNENVVDQAKIFLNEWIDHIEGLVTSNMILTECKWVDLDSLSGTTGTATEADAPRIMPSVGNGSATAMPGSATALITKRAGTARGSRSGRMFLSGLTEAGSDGQTLASATRTSIQAGIDLFLDGINQDGGTSFGGYDSHLVITRTQGGVFQSHDDVTELEVQSRLATQRRRLRG